MERRNSKKIKIGQIYIGGGSPIAVQSMTNSDTADKEATLNQLKQLESVGCDIARFTVNTQQAAANIGYYRENCKMPLVADIHFDYRLAIMAAEAGISKIRINPGNIGDSERVKAVVDVCKKYGVPIRIGVNSGSLEKEILEKYSAPTAEALAESALNNARMLERFDFYDTVISIKSSDVMTMIKANRILAESCDYPLHLGVTEAGTKAKGTVKSAIGIGSLLADGIGDTVRVSLTDDIREEIKAANDILCALKLKNTVNLVSCPTCGRCRINLIEIASKLQNALDGMNATKSLEVALMGCAVNGPGEARQADIGAAGGDGEALIFKKGVVYMKVPEDKLLETLMGEIEVMLKDKE